MRLIAALALLSRATAWAMWLALGFDAVVVTRSFATTAVPGGRPVWPAVEGTVLVCLGRDVAWEAASGAAQRAACQGSALLSAWRRMSGADGIFACDGGRTGGGDYLGA